MSEKFEGPCEGAQEDAGLSGRFVDIAIRVAYPPAAQELVSRSLKHCRTQLANVMTQEIQRVLDRVQKATGETPVQVCMFPNLGGAFVRASAEYVSNLLVQSEITGAMPLKTAPDK